MSETTDCLTQLEDTVRAAIKARVPGAKRVLGPEDLPVKAAYLPAVVVDIGDEAAPVYLGAEEGGERQQQRSVQVDVIVVLDAGHEEFRTLSRSLANQVRAALAGPRLGDLPLDDFRCVGAKPQTFASESGSQGGFHLAFLATFMSGESTPGEFIPLNDASELL